MDVQNRNQGNRGCFRARGGRQAERGASMLELALILPILIVLAYGVVDIGRLIHARLVITNVSREGGSLGSRDIRQGTALITMLQSSAAPYDLRHAEGRIFVTRIRAGASQYEPEPFIAWRLQGGDLTGALSSIKGGQGETPKGLSPAIYQHLQWRSKNSMADILEVTVVEVFYLYRPITPLPQFVKNLVLPVGSDEGMLIGSRAVF